MASTYSPTLRIELIGDGDQSGIWGQTTNNNLGTLLEQAITGVVTITMTDTNYTLTNYNGVSDEARNAVIVATGTNSAQRDIIAPLVEKVYTIKNSTVGGYAVRIIGVSGTGITIPNGVTTSVYCDGTNFYNMQVGTTGNETINGNLTVTGTTTLQGAMTGTTGVFSGAISSVSPTFTGTPTAPTAPSGTSTTQIATTAFVTNVTAALGTMSTQNANNVNITGGTIGASVAWGAMPAGTVLTFAQAAAPTGWTQVTNDTANNRMLRVVSSTGAGTGGTASPILMDVVPSHTHTYSSTSGGQSQNHAHTVSGTSGGMNSNATHSHSVSDPGHNHVYQRSYENAGQKYTDHSGQDTWEGWVSDGTTNSQTGISIVGANIDHTHTMSFVSGSASVDHTHSISGTTAANGAATNWAPRYIDLILCTKN